jgi:hypothetical protein
MEQEVLQRKLDEARAEVARREREHEALLETAQKALAHVERERDERRAARVAPTTIVVADPYPRRYASNIWGWPQYEGGFATPLPGIVGGVPVSPVYSSSPGAVQGRDAGGFIGSGFSTAR